MKTPIYSKTGFWLTFSFLLGITLFSVNVACSKKDNPVDPTDDTDNTQKPPVVTEDPFKDYLSISSVEDFLAIESGTADEIKKYVLKKDLNFQNFATDFPDHQDHFINRLVSYIHLEGDDKTISNISVVYSTDNTNSKQYVGIFPKLEHARIKNLNISEVHFEGLFYIGALIGNADHVELEAIDVSNSKIVGGAFVGGIAGKFDNSKILNSKTSGELVLLQRNGGGIAGGLYSPSHIENCSSTMSIDASLAQTTFDGLTITTGGIIGRIDTKNANSTESVIIKNNLAANQTIIGQPNTGSNELLNPNYPGFGRVIGAIRIKDTKTSSGLENNKASDQIEMFLANKTTQVNISSLNTSDIGPNQRHGETVTAQTKKRK